MAQLTRRGFLQRSLALGSGLALADMATGVYAAGDGTIRVGLVGCGGRGAGAISQILATGPDVRLTAMADLFPEQIESAKQRITKTRGVRNQVQVDADHQFTGFDACEYLLASGVDVVVLTTPPAFRPLHFDAAVKAGVHVFMEKPVAVDAPGVRSLLASSEHAKAKSLKVAVGLHHRHDMAYRQTIERLQEGAVGEIQSLAADWRTPGVWEPRVTRADVRNELELQIRNWLYFVWLSGEINLEQMIHNVDICNWLMAAHPVSAQGRCGRTVRVGSKYGDVNDEFVIDYVYADGTQLRAHARHGVDSARYVGESVKGSSGSAELNTGTINGQHGQWRFNGRKSNAHQAEQDSLFAAIRDDRPYNEVGYAADSQLTIVMGRMAAYTGETVTWEQALSSNESFVPNQLSLADSAPTMPDKFGDYLVPARGRFVNA